MNTKTSLNVLSGQSSESSRTLSNTSTSTSLEPYTGPWTYAQAAHLLRRTMFGPTNTQIKQAVADGMTTTVTQLLDVGSLPAPPVNYYYEDDPNVPIGASWIDQPHIPGNIGETRTYRFRSLNGWTTKLIYEEGISMREKMTLFWHNHFVTADIIDMNFRYHYINKLRTNALGDFRELTKIITIDPSMLRYLNGRQNRVEAPNENYARELLELFTIGKGPIAGPGDYTNYTEDDVVAIAKVLTGWRDRGFLNTNPDVEIGSYFTADLHDESDKQLSARFDNLVISNAGDLEYANLIDIIFQKDEVAYFICRKLYRWFVFYDITDDIELNVIHPMSQLLIANDYVIAPVIEALISSQHFYDEVNRGCMIKNPWDFTIGMIKEMGIQIPIDDLARYYEALKNLFLKPSSDLSMGYYNPPSVAGWTAYYQEPSYYQLWINAVSLPKRMSISSRFISHGVFVTNVPNPTIDFLALIDNLENPFEVNPLIDELVQMFFSRDITQNQKDYLKEILIPGLPDFEWNVEYSEYASDPSNQDLANSIKNKVRVLIEAIVSMPEYQLS